MNFFEHQDRARRNSRYLVLLLATAVVSLISITTLLIATLVYFGGEQQQPVQNHWQGIMHALSPTTFFWIALGVSGVVLLGSLFRYVQLRAGGKTVAESMGGRLLSNSTRDIDEQKILNVVEEMAIASGTAVPPVYLIEEESINAFAAGYLPQDAVIGITRGCIQNLSRDELQGVIAHEFSHVFHGDMRINMRLISLLYGILVIGLIGEFLIRIAGNRSGRRSSKDNSPAAILALGVGLLVIGYTGIFFGNLIKAAVSRQREFLADASAVQFTRNPEGIAGALKKIGGNAYGSRLHHAHAAEFSHMYFGEGVKSFLNLMATHPPLAERIKRIQPNWDGEFTSGMYIRTQATASQTVAETTAGFASASDSNNAMQTGATTPITQVDIERAINQIAQPTSAQVDYAQACLAELPSDLYLATHESFSARAVVFGLLMDRADPIANQQMALLAKHLGDVEFQQLKPLIVSSASTSPKLRLPLIELSLPALKQLSAAQQADFLQCMNLLISADQKTSLMEWSLHRIVVYGLNPPASLERNHKLIQLKRECGILLSMLAQAGSREIATAQAAFRRAEPALKIGELEFLPVGNIRTPQLDNALDQLNRLRPLQKPQLLKALALCILHDDHVSIVEAELFRAIADSLDCPVPPLLLERRSRIQ